MVKKSLEIIVTQVQNILIDKGFSRYDLQKDDKTLATFSDGKNYYSIEFEKENKTVNLLKGPVESNQIMDDAAVVSTWLFDPATDGDDQAMSIARDFVDTLAGPSAPKAMKKKQNKGSEENTSSPTFFMNRLATVFPELKDNIQCEKANHESFRFVTFVKENVVPKVQTLLSMPHEKSQIKKLGKTLSDNYNNGDLDVRSLITIVILNSVEKNESALVPYLSEDLQKAWDAAKRVKGKDIKPEKQQKKSFMSRLMENSAEINNKANSSV